MGSLVGATLTLLLALFTLCGAEEMSLANLVSRSSVTGKHGIQKRCGCKKGQCLTKNCACFKAGVPCHSGCHGKGGCDCKNQGS